MVNQNINCNIEDESLWRLRTKGGIPYKFLGMEGSFENNDARATWTVLIKDGYLCNFVEEMLPYPEEVGFISTPKGYQFPGMEGIYALRVNFSAFDRSKPIDPFLDDPEGTGTNPLTGFPVYTTYGPFIRCDVEFGPMPELVAEEVDPEDPTTFLDISSNTTGEFIYFPTNYATEKDFSIPVANRKQGDIEIYEQTYSIDPNTGKISKTPIYPTVEGTVTGGAAGLDELSRQKSNNPYKPTAVFVPQTEWSLKWRNIPFDKYRDTIIHRLRYLTGKVNEYNFDTLFAAWPETLLLTGHSYEQHRTWKRTSAIQGLEGCSGKRDEILVDVEIKILEKSIIDYDAATQAWGLVGHNHFWVPGQGWRRLLVNGDATSPNTSVDRSAYKKADFDFLFQL